MTNRIPYTLTIAALVFGVAAWPRAQQTQPPANQEITTVIKSDASGQPPRLALPEFIALTKDAETAAIAHTITQVLWDDLNYEHEFSFVPRDVYATIPAAVSLETVAFDRWRELNPDGLVIGTVEKSGAGIKVVLRI